MANTIYANKIIEKKATDLLTTAVNTRSLMSIDNALAQDAGMTKSVITYIYDGVAEELEQGEANANRGALTQTTTDYTVKLVQQVWDYYDEEFMKDNAVVDNGVKGMTQTMANKMTADFVAALEAEDEGVRLISNSVEFDGELSYDAIVDAISEINVEDESKLFVLIPNAWKAGLRKDADYVAARMGEVVYNG